MKLIIEDEYEDGEIFQQILIDIDKKDIKKTTWAIMSGLMLPGVKRLRNEIPIYITISK